MSPAANVSVPAWSGSGAPRHVRVVGKVAPVRASARGLVIGAYQGYWRATTAALASANASQASAIIAGYVPRRAIPALVRGYREIWGHDEVGYGGPVFHIMSVTITGGASATVHDCVDLSRAGFANRQTGQVVGAPGSAREFLITTLALEHGRWLVTGAMRVGQRCTR